MSNREELSPILIAIHNACIALEKTKEYKENQKCDKRIKSRWC